jgi:choline dehydrogenase-like flavoprotein
VEIRARGGKAKRHKASTPKQAPPPVPPLESLRKRLNEAQKTLQSARHRLPTNLRNQWRPGGYDYCRDGEWMIREVESRTKHRAIGRTVAKILSRHGVHAEHAEHSIYRYKPEDYADLDIACGRKVDRQSKVSERSLDRHHGYLGWIVNYYAGSWRFGRKKAEEFAEDRSMIECREKNAIQSFLEVNLEVEYLTEMVRLATRGEA